MTSKPEFLLAVVTALLLAAPAAADTKLFVRLDSAGPDAKDASLRIRNNDGQLLKEFPPDGASNDLMALDAWNDQVPPSDKQFREFDLELSDGKRVAARAKMVVDARQVIQLLGHEPSTLRQFHDAERGSIVVTVYPSAGRARKMVRDRYESATLKKCPELFATVDYTGKLPDFQPVLQSELKPSAASPDEKRDVLYSSLEVARCIRFVGEHDTTGNAEYRPAIVRRYDDWMTKHFAVLRNKTLAEITLPGTHDSGAWELSDHKSPERSTAEWLAGLSMNITKPWAITQRLDIRGQLVGGIRWLDMRTAFDGNDFYFHHALLGVKTRDMLKQIRQFVDAPGHEHELIVLEFCNWQGFSAGSPEKLWQRLGEMILAELGEDNIYRKSAAGAVRSEAELIKTRLGDILASSKSRVIVFFQGHTEQAPFAFDAYEAFGGSYANRHLWPNVEADQKAKLAAHQPSKLFVLSWTVTANQETISTDLENRGHPDRPAFDLEYLSRAGQADAMRQIAEWPGHEKINVVICDFFDSSPLLPLCFKLNGIDR